MNGLFSSTLGIWITFLGRNRGYGGEVGPEVVVLSVSGVLDCSAGVDCGKALSDPDCGFIIVYMAYAFNEFDENDFRLD